MALVHPRIACLSLAGILFAFLPHATSAATQSKAKKGQSNMLLDLRIKLKRAEIITGESLPVEVTLANESDASVDVPDSRVGSEFRYTVRSHSDANAVSHLSEARARAERTQEPPIKRDLPGKKLAPGATEIYQEDLVDYEVPLLAPGQYDVVAGYQGAGGLVESAPAPLTIKAPHVVRMATVAGVNEERIGVVFAHAMDAKKTAVYQVENAAKRPGDGGAYVRKDGVPSASMHGLAIAVDRDDNDGRRWIAWLEDDRVGAALGQEKYVSHAVAPVALGLKAASFATVGCQPTPDEALFIARGTSADGHAAVTVASFNVNGPGTAKTIPVAGPAKPDAWTVQYRSTKAQIELVTAEHSGSDAKIVRQRLDLATATASAPAVLIERAGPVAAMAMDPLNGNAVDVVFGPDAKTGYLSFLRLPLGGGAVPAAWDFSPPKNAAGKHPTAWAIPRALLGTPVVVTHVGDTLYARRVGGEWIVVVGGVALVEHLSVEALRDGSLVAVWSDPTFGIRYHAVP